MARLQAPAGFFDDMYASCCGYERRPTDAKDEGPWPWRSFHPNPVGVEMHGEELASIRPVRVTVDPAGPYWAWWDSGEYLGKRERKPGLSMIFPKEFLTEMCFPYGSEVKEERGEGQKVRVRVEELPGTEEDGASG